MQSIVSSNVCLPENISQKTNWKIRLKNLKICFTVILVLILAYLYPIVIIFPSKLNIKKYTTDKLYLMLYEKYNFTLFFFCAILASVFCYILNRKILITVIALGLAGSFGFLTLFSFECLVMSRVLGGFTCGLIFFFIPEFLASVAPFEFSAVVEALYPATINLGYISFWVFSNLISNDTMFYIFCFTYLSLAVALLCFFLIDINAVNDVDKYQMGLWKTLKTSNLRIPCLCLFLFHIINNLSGISVLSLEPQAIFSSAQITTLLPLGIGLGTLSAFSSGFFIKKWGIKTITLVSGLSLIIINICLFFKVFSSVFGILLPIFFSLGIGTTPFIIMNSILPKKNRNSAKIISIIPNLSGNMLSTFFVSSDSNSKNFNFLLFALFTATFCIIISILYFENPPKDSEEELQEINQAELGELMVY